MKRRPTNELETNTASRTRRLAALAAGALASAALALGMLAGCAAPEQQQAPSQSQSQSAESASSEETPSVQVTSADENALAELIGDEAASDLVDQAKASQAAAWIAANSDAFDIDGPEVQVKILKLAAVEPIALGFVRGFPDQYPQRVADKSLSPVVPEDGFKSTFQTNVPHFFQWDPRWGYLTYSSAAFGLTGCGPTSMAMIYQGMTGKSDLMPSDMALRAEHSGFMTEFNGTSVEFFYDEAEKAGFHCYEMEVSADNIVDTLREGNLVIANLGEGYFTEGGHFFVLAGLSSDGKVIVNDPYSYERSTKTWDADFIAEESIALFGFSTEEHESYVSPYDVYYDEGAGYDEAYE